MEIKKRYQVFISSTYIDLTDERKEVLHALLELDCIPAGMELFPAANDDQWSYIKKIIDDSDYYLLIIGNRYGSLDEFGVSYTEKEYDYAISKSIPIISFLNKDPDLRPVNKSEIDKDAREKLKLFRKKVSKKLTKEWTTSENLGAVVSRSIVKLIKDSPMPGYVRGGGLSDPLLVTDLKEQIRNLEGEINSYKLKGPEGTENLSQGEDKIKLSFYYDFSKSEPFQLSLSWNQILKIIGPLMYDESTERKIRNALGNHAEQSTKGRPGEFILRPTLTDESFGEILTQFIALGYIKKGQKKKAASDREIYWSLTPYGENAVIKLNSIPKEN